MNINIEKINKDLALEMLSRNTKNRKITRANVDFLKEEMLSNRFKLNGQSIVFDKNGNLIDGQHRLTAISEIDKTIEIIVARDVENEAFLTIDTGKTRAANDVFSIERIPYANNMASAVRRIIEKFDQSRKASKHGSIKLSNSEVLDFFKENEVELTRDMEFVTNLYNAQIRVVTPSVSCAMLFLLKRINKQKARSFIREIYTGTSEIDDRSALTLRKRLLNHKIEGKRLNLTNYRNLFLSAFNGYCNNKNLTKLQINQNKYFLED